MTRQEFIDAVAAKADLSRRDAAAAVDAILDSLTEALQRGDTITFTGFGKFSTSERAARETVDPRDPSQRVHIPAATVPKFSAGSQLRSAVKHARSGLAGDPDVPWDDEESPPEK